APDLSLVAIAQAPELVADLAHDADPTGWQIDVLAAPTLDRRRGGSAPAEDDRGEECQDAGDGQNHGEGSRQIPRDDGDERQSEGDADPDPVWCSHPWAARTGWAATGSPPRPQALPGWLPVDLVQNLNDFLFDPGVALLCHDDPSHHLERGFRQLAHRLDGPVDLVGGGEESGTEPHRAPREGAERLARLGRAVQPGAAGDLE